MDRWLCPLSFGRRKCRCPIGKSSSSLSYSAGPVSSSFSVESLELVYGLEWCNSHLKACHFQSALFKTDSQLALTLLSIAPVFLQPKSFWDIFDSLFSHAALSFQCVPSHARLPGNEWAVSHTQTRATFHITHSCTLPSGSDHCKDQTHSLLLLETKARKLSHNSLAC